VYARALQVFPENEQLQKKKIGVDKSDFQDTLFTALSKAAIFGKYGVGWLLWAKKNQIQAKPESGWWQLG